MQVDAVDAGLVAAARQPGLPALQVAAQDEGEGAGADGGIHAGILVGDALADIPWMC